MIVLTKQQIIVMHHALVMDTGGLDGLRDEGLLDSALAAPFQTFDTAELFQSVQQKAARLACGLIQNHPFLDGNKRIGVHAMLVFLALNGIFLSYTQDELSSVFLKIAAGELDYNGLLQWVIDHEKSEED
ncbi:MAG: type II toxin-antitoxin system death-on-curing family toxin [Clostridiales bacterium]|nr:MAG: type II toxin-antitoxin system death-on-curing family toxin [Clostridiales bacterium]